MGWRRWASVRGHTLTRGCAGRTPGPFPCRGYAAGPVPGVRMQLPAARTTRYGLYRTRARWVRTSTYVNWVVGWSASSGTGVKGEGHAGSSHAISAWTVSWPVFSSDTSTVRVLEHATCMPAACGSRVGSGGWMCTVARRAEPPVPGSVSTRSARPHGCACRAGVRGAEVVVCLCALPRALSRNRRDRAAGGGGSGFVGFTRGLLGAVSTGVRGPANVLAAYVRSPAKSVADGAVLVSFGVYPVPCITAACATSLCRCSRTAGTISTSPVHSDEHVLVPTSW